MLLPNQIDPIQFAKKNAQMQGEILLRTLPRLQEIVDQYDLTARVTLQFGQNEKRICFIKGSITTTVNLICQRCGEMMQDNMVISVSLSPVTSDELAKTLPNNYDPILMQAGQILLHEMAEDEILLALPMIPKHEQCELTHTFLAATK